jgi:hypothetical protein
LLGEHLRSTIEKQPTEIALVAGDVGVGGVALSGRFRERRNEASVGGGRGVPIADRNAVVAEGARADPIVALFSSVDEAHVGIVAGGTRLSPMRREIAVTEQALAELRLAERACSRGVVSASR